MADYDDGKIQHTTEKGLFYLGLAIPFVSVFVYIVYQKVLAPFWPVKGCIWDLFFGIYCPGCGGTRAVEALLQGQLLESFRYHPVVLYAVALYGAYMISHSLSFLTKGRVKGMRFRSLYLYAAILIILINCLIRNILRIRFDILL